MYKNIHFLLLLACILPNILLAEATPVPTTIDKVTVFLNGAQVSRKGQVSLISGKQELIFKGVSPKISPQSIQVKLEGENTLLSVVHQLNKMEEQNKRTEIEALEKQQKTVIEKITEEKAMMSVYSQEEAMLNQNQDIKGNETGLKTADLREALDFHRQRLTELKMKALESNKKLKDWGEELGKINQQLVNLNQKKDLSTSEILVTVFSPKAQTVNLTVSYLVNEAKWYPTYDIRVKDIASPLSLAYKANVLQASGEDWKDVKLTLSTGNPNLSGQKPSLNPWYLGYYTPTYNNYYTTPTSTVTGSTGTNPYKQISGRITDQNGVPLLGAAVMVADNAQIGAYTDENGYYTLTNLGANDNVVKVHYIGYESIQTPINSTVVNLSMREMVASADEVVITSGKKKTKQAVGQMDIVTGGTPADYGDFTEGAVSLNKIRSTPDLPESRLLNSLSGKVAGMQVGGQKQYKLDKSTLSEFSMTTISFDIESPYTIPNDGKNYMVEIKTYDIPAFYEYYCAPKLDPDAFLTANIKDWADYHLIDGETNLFFEGTFIGKAYLDLQNSGDTLQISLGRDKSVIINRTLLKDYAKNQLIGNYRTQNIAYEISVRNNKRLPIQLTLEDQYPVSSQKEITVERVENKDAQVEENTGKLTWKLLVEPGKERKVGFKYDVKYPKGTNVNVK